MPKLLEISIVCLMIGAGIVAVAAIFYGLWFVSSKSIGFNLRETIEFFAIGMAFGAVGAVFRNIHYWIKNRKRKN